METKKIVMGVISVAVAIIVLMSMIPIFTDAGASEDTFTNDGYFTMDKITATDTTTHTISWTSSNGKILTVDGVDMDITTWGLSPAQLITVFATETDIIRLGVINGQQALAWVQIRGATINYAGASNNFDATIGSGTVTAQFDSETNPRTMTYTDAYIINNAGSGDYVMKKSTESAFMLEDSPIYAIGTTDITVSGVSKTVIIKIDGNIEGVTVSTLYINNDDEPTYSDIVIDATEHSGYVGLYDFNKITFTGTIGTDTKDYVYSYVIVPHEVTAERSAHASPVESTLIGLIPLLMMVGIMLTAIGLFIAKYRKN